MRVAVVQERAHVHGLIELLLIRIGTGERLAEQLVHFVVTRHGSHRCLRGDVGIDSVVHGRRIRLEVGGQVLVLAGQVILLLFVHLLLDDNLFGDLEASARSAAVNLRRHSRGLHTSFQATVGTPRSGDVCSLLVLFVGPLSLWSSWLADKARGRSVRGKLAFKAFAGGARSPEGMFAADELS